MIPQIASAISKGFTSSQVIKFLLRKFPNQKDAIEKALSAGFTADQVIRYLSRKSGKELEEPNKPQINTDYSQMRDIDKARRQKEEKIGMTALASPFAAQAGLSALSRLSAPTQAAAQGMAMQHAIPRNPTALPGNIPQPLLQGPTQQPPINPQGPSPITPQPPQPMPGTPNIPQPPQSLQPIQPQRDIKKSVDIIKNSGQEGTVKNLIEGGMSPTDIKDTLSVILGKKKLKELDTASGGIEQAIEDYASSITQQQPEAPPEIAEQLTNPEMPIEQEELSPGVPTEKMEDVPVEEQIKPIQKNETVSTPHGIGEVKEIRNGKALVEVDGKIHKVDEEEIEKPLYTDDEIADAYNRLMEVIPEEHKSRFISWAGYDPETKVLGYIPRGGKYEELHDITPEEAELIKTGKGVARTTGESREGYHIVGGDTRGLISQIQHDRRRAREALDKQQLRLFEEPKRKKEDRGTKPLFDEMAYPRGLSQARDKKQEDEARAEKKKAKEEEKARLKREKDEAKKRKK